MMTLLAAAIGCTVRVLDLTRNDFVQCYGDPNGDRVVNIAYDKKGSHYFPLVNSEATDDVLDDSPVQDAKSELVCLSACISLRRLCLCHGL